MKLDLTQFIGYCTDQQFTWCKVYESNYNNVANFNCDKTDDLVEKIKKFGSMYPGVYNLELKQHDTTKPDRMCKVQLDCLPVGVQPVAAPINPVVEVANKMVEATDPAVLYEKVKNDILAGIKKDAEVETLRTKAILLEHQIKEHHTAAGKVATAMELLLTNIFGNSELFKQATAGTGQTVLQGAGNAQVQTQPKQKNPVGFKTPTQLRKEAREAEKAQTPAQQQQTQPAQQEQAAEGEFTADQIKLSDAINKLFALGYKDSEVATMFETVANACEQHPTLFHNITPQKLNQLAPFLK